MKFEERTNELREKAEQLVNFTPQEIKNISAEEIQRLFYDLQVYQIELEMQNDELQTTQYEVTQSRNRFSIMYHQIPIGIITVNHQGFITDTNHYFCEMVNMEQQKLIKNHLSSLIVEEDKNIFINRFDAFFKYPEKKSMNLRLQGNQNKLFHAKLLGTLDNGSDSYSPESIEPSKLIISVTDISDVIFMNNQ